MRISNEQQFLMRLGLFFLLIYTPIHMVLQDAMNFIFEMPIPVFMNFFLSLLNAIVVFCAIFAAMKNIYFSILLSIFILTEFFISALFSKENAEFIPRYINGIIVNILSASILVGGVNINEKLLKTIWKIGVVFTACCLFEMFICVLKIKDIWYDMTFGNCAAFASIILWGEGLYKRKRRYFLLSITFILGIVAFGSRGGLGCVGVFVISSSICFFIQNYRRANYVEKVKARHNLSLFFSIILALVLLIMIILAYLRGMEVNTGIRTVDKLINGEIFSSSGRVEWFYTPIIERLKETWLFGNGLFSDRLLIDQNYVMLRGASESLPEARYTHNIILEILFEFGALRGGAILFGFIGIVGFAWKKIKCSFQNQLIFLMFFSMSILLMYSSSYLQYAYFWILIGYCIQIDLKGVKNNERNLVTEN